MLLLPAPLLLVVVVVVVLLLLPTTGHGMGTQESSARLTSTHRFKRIEDTEVGATDTVKNPTHKRQLLCPVEFYIVRGRVTFSKSV
jgi:hypothetical protein